MPIIDEGKVPDPRHTTRVPSDGMLTGGLTRLAALAAHCTYPVWMWQKRQSARTSDWGVQRAEVWFKRASGASRKSLHLKLCLASGGDSSGMTSTPG